MSSLRIAVVQMSCGEDSAANIARAEDLVRRASGEGAGLVLLQELFAMRYFCAEQDARHLDSAREFEGNELLARMSALARECGVVLPVSFFERDGLAYYNSVAMIDADGRVPGCYRKSHIPDGPGYQEKFYFRAGDTGFRVWETAAGRVGVGICWDQWFPEAARAMVLGGAEVLLYPSAIGVEPQDLSYDSSGHWRRVMCGHSAANMCVLAAANRVGVEEWDGVRMEFYGGSFIAGGRGEVLAEAGGDEEVIYADVDLGELARERLAWGIFRDRRPDLYGALSDN
ncbi:MAG: N-carbamoylputrescine amidase [Alphaproteobacteria bacterium]|nr:N-carbamoylputrescine amidase [Alphaproteobacteria bacterium]MDA8003769.1 N-carbamoylputrescine amidase [Alphaproteobacteria bacterium]MDA8005928.1 N-carbamoylputrescine amidase [Alphaproteobacteria bacterium]MDA8013335.1 N-carbamoylputrescine amidase [Alphaproteobacteria bacterium]